MYPMSPLDKVRALIYLHYWRLNPWRMPDGPLDIDWKSWFGDLTRESSPTGDSPYTLDAYLTLRQGGNK